MGLLDWARPFRKREQRAPLRAIVATRRESRAAAAKAVEMQLALAVYVATTAPEQRRAETEAFFANAAKARGMA